jgi:hypothetical protein
MEPERAYDHAQTRVQLLREAIELIDAWSSGRETPLDGREWLKTARRELAAIDGVSAPGDSAA